MINRGNKRIGWHIFLLAILVIFNNISNVKALEEEIVIEDSNTIETEEIIQEEVITEEVVTEEEIIPEDNLNSEEDIIIEEEKTKEEIFTMNSQNLEFKENEVIVKGNINELTTVKEILDNINTNELINNYNVEKISITNEENIFLTNEDYVTNKCHIVIISNEFIANYKISFLGDLNQDNLVTNEDIETGIDNFFKEEKEEVIEETLPEVETEEVFLEDVKEEIIEEEKTITEEISYIDAVIKNNSYEVVTPNTEEELNINLENTTNEEKYINDKVIIELSINNFNNNYINTISGNIEYNNEILELENIYLTVDNKVIGKTINNKFIYVLDNYHDSKPLLLIIFKSIKNGTTSISINDLEISMNGKLINYINNTNLDITILEYGKGGDIETPPIIIPAPTPSLPKPQTKPITTNNTPTKEPEPIPEIQPQLSNDNYIKDIVITNHEILFDKDINHYSIDVDNNTNSLNLNITLNNEFATYNIIGNENFKTGKNEIIITVTSQNNETRDYIIEVNKKEETPLKEEIKSKEPPHQTLHIIVLIILIITIIILIYKLLRSDE